jgi:hypothetical protein
MAKESGITMSVNVDDSGGSARDISNDITNFDFATPRGVQETTGIDKSASERLQLLADFSITLNGIFDDGSNLAHAVLKTVPSSSVARTVTIVVSGQTLPNETFFNDYSLSRAATGELTFTAPGTLTGGVVPTWA